MIKHIKQGTLRGEKVKYLDGIGYCIWYPFEDDDNAGPCFDFPDEDIDDLITLVQKLKVTEARIFKDEEDE